MGLRSGQIVKIVVLTALWSPVTWTGTRRQFERKLDRLVQSFVRLR
jgi:hypothetical protein